MTPLFLAVEQSDVESCKLLLRAKANPNFLSLEEGTPIYQAVKQGSLECVKLLLKSKAQLNICENTDAETPLDIAIKLGHTEIADYLASKGARESSDLNNF